MASSRRCPAPEWLERRDLLSGTSSPLDPSFGNGGEVKTTPYSINAIALQSGKILVFEYNLAAHGPGAPGFLRYDPDGAQDTTFGNDGVLTLHATSTSVVDAFAVRPNGDIVVATDDRSTSPDIALSEYDADGTALVSGFGNSGQVVTNLNAGRGVSDFSSRASVGVQQDGSILATVASGATAVVERFTNNGSLDTTYGTGGSVTVSNYFSTDAMSTPSITVTTDGGTVLTAGEERLTSGVAFRLTPAGQLETNYGNSQPFPWPVNGRGELYIHVFDLVEAAPDGSLIWCGTGDVSGSDGRPVTVLERYTPQGTLDAGFGNNGNAIVDNPDHLWANDVLVGSNGQFLLLGGNDTTNVPTIRRINADGSVDLSFGVNGLATVDDIGSGHLTAGALLPNGRILAAAITDTGSTTHQPESEYLIRFLANATGGASSAHSAYVAAVYHDVLGRAPDADGLAYWKKQLDAGAAISSVAAAIGTSNEYYQNFVIKPDYLKILGRAADAGGVGYWTGKMDAGTTDQQLEAELAASDEVYADAGGTDLAWVGDAYKLLLKRTAEADGENYWAGQLAAGVSRIQVAEGIAESQENNTNLIEADYQQYLGRAADPQGLAYWLGQFADGKTNEDVIAGFTGSDEYYNEHTS